METQSIQSVREQATQAAQTAVRTMSKRSKDIGGNVSSYVRQHPATAIGIAVGVAAAIGALLFSLQKRSS